MNIETIADGKLRDFYKGDTLNIFYEFLGPDKQPLDVSGFKLAFGMKLNPLSQFFGKHDINKVFEIPFNANSRRGLGEITILTKDTIRLIALVPYTYSFILITPRDEHYTIGSDLVNVGINPVRFPNSLPYVDNPTVFPRNANAQIITFNFSKLMVDVALFDQITIGLRTSYSNQMGKANIDSMAINKRNGLVGLDHNGKLPESSFPQSILDLMKASAGRAPDDVYTATSKAGMLALVVKQGDIVTRSDTGNTYVNKNGKNVSMNDWIKLGGGGVPVTVSDIAPPNPVVGQQWFNTGTGLLGTYYDDGTTGQWVAS